MAPAARTVRRLRLRASSEAAIRRTARVLDDALRTATLPDAGGRMLFVRRLALGRLAPDVQPVSVALALEEAVARVGVEWRHGDESGAAAASAVWFRDPLEAHVALARRVLAGTPVEAWYWPLAVPAWNRGMTWADGLRAIAHSLAARAEAPVALPRWFGELVEGGYGGRLAAALRAEDAEPLACAAGVPALVRLGAPASRRAEPPYTGGGAVHRLILVMLDRAGGAGALPRRSTIAGDARQAPDPAVGVPPPRGYGEIDPTLVEQEGEDARGGASPAQRPRGSDPSLLRFGGDAERRRADSTRKVVRGAGGGPVEAVATPEPRRPELSRPWLAPTAAGGLLFLLHALERVGYGEWLDAQSEWESQDVARRVMTRVLARLNVSPEDPAWAVVRRPASMAPPPRRFVAPTRWRHGLCSGPPQHVAMGGEHRLYDTSGRLLLGGWRGSCPRPLIADRAGAAASSRRAGGLTDEVVGAWENAVRRWLRRFARLSVVDLVLRPASIAATSTHLDVHFDLASADPRVRRVGLDLDPGWLPWFERVIAFHYGPRGRS